MDICFGKIWMSLKSLVDVSSCVFGDDNASNNEINNTPHITSLLDIIGQAEESIHDFIQRSLHNLENNATFYS